MHSFLWFFPLSSFSVEKNLAWWLTQFGSSCSDAQDNHAKSIPARAGGQQRTVKLTVPLLDNEMAGVAPLVLTYTVFEPGQPQVKHSTPFKGDE